MLSIMIIVVTIQCPVSSFVTRSVSGCFFLYFNSTLSLQEVGKLCKVLTAGVFRNVQEALFSVEETSLIQI